jgi:hypothetical protein
MKKTSPGMLGIAVRMKRVRIPAESGSLPGDPVL